MASGPRGARSGRGLRVIAGSARGRRLVAPVGDAVRPTKDRVREAVFSALDARGAIVDAAVLDLYAGSGALAIEALSRGARSAVLVERDARAVAAITANLATTGFESVARVEARDVVRVVAAPSSPTQFDLVFADPPYESAGADITQVLGDLVRNGWFADGAIVVVERPVAAPVPAVLGLETVWERRFGDTLMTFLAPAA